MSNIKRSFSNLAIAIAATGALTLPAVVTYADSHASDSTSMEQSVKQGWKEGVIEGAFLFNTNLNPLDIDVEVKGSTAILSGYVDTDAAKALAEQVALSVDGITDVDNQIKVDKAKSARDDDTMDDLKSDISDAAITTKVKSKLLANTQVSGLSVNVDTKDRVVTLKGKVDTDTERDLVYYIARNTDGVRGINNELTVKK